MNSWDLIRNYLQQKLSAQSYDNWLKGTSFLETDGATLFVSVPDRETREWLEDCTTSGTDIYIVRNACI